MAFLSSIDNLRGTLLMCAVFLVVVSPLAAQNKYEGRAIASAEIVFSDTGASTSLAEQYRQIVREVLGATYSTPRIRDAIDALYATGRIDTISVEAALDASERVVLTFNVKRKTVAERVSVVIIEGSGDRVTEQDILYRLDIASPGAVITEQTLKDDADEILDYLRDRGFYQSEVTFERVPRRSAADVGVSFRVSPGAQSRVESFTINIDGVTKPITPELVGLKVGDLYSRDRLRSAEERVRSRLRSEDFLAPTLSETRVIYDSETNGVALSIEGKVGPTVKVVVDSEESSVGGRAQNRLLPIKREGSLDFSAIEEGSRRLENYYQEQGYFFNDVTPICSVKPPIEDQDGRTIDNETRFLCQYMNTVDLSGKEVEIRYRAALNRRLRLTEIRITGTEALPVDEIKPILRSKEANILGIVPLLGYGRGYTSEAILADDTATLTSIMRELGYRQAEVRVIRGVSPDGENLIITFAIQENAQSFVKDVTITGNSTVPTTDLTAQLPQLIGLNYSRARARNAARKLSEYYQNLGYYDARVTPELIETPINETETDTTGERRDVSVVFKITNEGKKVVINRIIVDGNEATKTSAIERAITLKKDELLKATDVYTSEQNLYTTDVFERVEIKPQPAGDLSDDTRLTDVLVSVNEQPARLLSYGGGASTDLGVSGFFDIRHLNLFGNLWQAGARVSISQRRQLVQLDFLNPRFLRDGKKRFTPLTFSAQYQRDSTVTRFFRSTFDKGTFGIVQRIDEEGNPIDEFGRAAGSPTINRLTLSAETSRTISREKRSILFLKYRFEDVRLFNTESLLIKDLLRPDQVTRISGLGATFVYDTRRNCAIKYSVLDLITKGDQTEKCRYNASDPTNGQFLTADYNVSFPILGANVGFQKFQAQYNYFYSFPKLKNAVIAARGILGLGQVFSNGNRFNSTDFPSLNGLLPISERFFAGGANNLRGFDFEEAGPRVVIVPRGRFRNSEGEQIFLDPFSIPFGGNGLAVVNIEGRVPFTDNFRIVPFYDGGNVFRKVSDIFRPPPSVPNNVALQNQRAVWTHTAGLGIRLKTPIGGEFGVDYARLLNPPRFLIPQSAGGNAIFQLPRDQIHFRFSQAF